MRVSATAENASQMMTMTLNFWNCTNSGIMPTAMEVPSPPPGTMWVSTVPTVRAIGYAVISGGRHTELGERAKTYYADGKHVGGENLHTPCEEELHKGADEALATPSWRKLTARNTGIILRTVMNGSDCTDERSSRSQQRG